MFLIDTDAGIDDAHAIMMALRHPQHKVIGITCVQGNTKVDQVCRNVFRLLKVCKRLDIPVYQGVSTSLVGINAGPSFYHGNDGFGDAPEEEPQDYSALVQKEHAVNTIVRLVNGNPGKLTLIGLGPLTNIAMAIRLDPDLGKKLKDCYIMGGNYQGKGNITTSAEFNFHSDPEAAHVVLNELGCPITIATWELCLQHSLTWEWYGRFINQSTEKAKLMKRIEKNNIENWYGGGGTTKLYGTADEITMATALDKSVAIEAKHVYATLELNGSTTRGHLQ
ncbi:unnamed protein product [Owenia fusiformis]|uniref:Uncharacterized protein n=1 Tax=Owenia fusiformis TaxID=6347 RepID=A0A8J1V0U2_OWEFU|nr:unnamed protein product [Owenia fusiformis]